MFLRAARITLPALALASLLGAGRVLAFCTDCHLELRVDQDRVSVHQPYRDDCLSCHGEHYGEGRLILVEEGNELCYLCHDPEEGLFQGVHRGMPVHKRECTSCHDPHSSDKIKLLRRDIHRPLAYGQCGDCHRQDGQLLFGDVSLLCLGCHELRSFRGVSRHEPVVKEDCTVCHDPHGSRNFSLLFYPYSEERFSPFSEEAYGLCFSCHDPSPFAVPGKEAETGFRDFRDNLHYLHTAKRKVLKTGGAVKEGITCRNCHLPHASPRPHLIREDLDCGGGVLCLKLEYMIRGDVGTCTAGCHKPISYSPAGDEGDRWLDTEAISGPLVVEAASLPPLAESGCLPCHLEDWERFQRPLIHDPVRKKRCDECHLDHGPENRLMLLAYEGRLCVRCHDGSTQAFREAHGGFEVMGSHCFDCHDPHSSKRQHLLFDVTHDPFEDRSCDGCHDSGGESWSLSRPANEICRGCHDDQFEHTYVHGAINERSCTGCHDPHASPLDKLLRANNPELCYQCHDRFMFNKEYRHPPAEEGDCHVCHDVHGSDRPSLLVAAYAQERYRGFDSAEYELCFTCHDDAPFLEEHSDDTGFRRGGWNLHYLHSRDRKKVTSVGSKIYPGSSCRNCHEPHSTKDPALIRRVLDCGGVPCLTLEFKKAGESGRCSRGCHTPQIYSAE